MRMDMKNGYNEKLKKYDNFPNVSIPIVINHRFEMLDLSIKSMEKFFNMDLMYKLVAFHVA